MKGRIFALALAVCLLAGVVGCGKDGDGWGEDPNFPVVVKGEDIPAEPVAIVSLSPGTTELLFAMGHGGKVVGVGDYDDLPAGEVTKRHRCGTTLSPNRDAILALAPDLVVAGAPLIESDLRWFQQQEIPVVVLPRANTMGALEENYLALATAVGGKTDGAAAGAQYWASLTAKLEEAAALAQGQQPLGVVLLRELDYQMATGDTLEHQLLEQAGFVNQGAAYTNWLYDKEQAASLNPDVIFADQSVPVESIRASAVYKPAAAVAQGRIKAVDLGAFERQSPRMFDLLLEMARYGYDGTAAS